MAENPFYALTTTLVKSVEPFTREDSSGAEFLVYSLSDVSATFNRATRSFVGLSLQALGVTFVYTGSVLAVIEVDETVQEVTDPSLLQKMAEYARWRKDIFDTYDL